MENTKITYAMALDNAISMVTDREVAEKLMALKESLAKKSSKKNTEKADKINAPIFEGIRGILADGKSYTVTELIKASGLDVSSQKMSAMLKKLVENGEVTNYKEGKSSLYKANSTVEVEG